jgi:hypothetical protein
MSQFDDRVPQVLVGDFNAYFDWGWPMDWLTGALPEALWMSDVNGCAPIFRSYQTQPRMQHARFAFRDVWEVVRENTPLPTPPISVEPGSPTAASHFGLTFPTYSDSRTTDSCRADRILISGNAASQNLAVCDVTLFGDETFLDNDLLMHPSDHRGTPPSPSLS